MKKLLVLTLIYLVSCTKDDDKQSLNPNLLTSGKWYVESIFYDPPIDFLFNGVFVTDVFPYYDPCEKDNYFEFVLPSILNYEEGPTKCWPSAPQTEYGTWKLLNNDSQVEISDGIETILFDITGNKLIGKYNLPDFDSTNGGKDYVLTATLILK
jgi:hypothetical protein